MIRYKKFTAMATAAAMVATAGFNSQAADNLSDPMRMPGQIHVISLASLFQTAPEGAVAETKAAAGQALKQYEKQKEEERKAAEAEKKAKEEAERAEAERIAAEQAAAAQAAAEQAAAEQAAAEQAAAEQAAAEQAAAEQAAMQEEAAAQEAVLVSSGDQSLLAALIFCEAGNQPYEGQVAVGAVVMNRVRSGVYPNSISEVIYQSGQFSPAMSGWLDSVLASGGYTDSAMQAAADALAGSNPIGDYLYFDCGGVGYQLGDHFFH